MFLVVGGKRVKHDKHDIVKIMTKIKNKNTNINDDNNYKEDDYTNEDNNYNEDDNKYEEDDYKYEDDKSNKCEKLEKYYKEWLDTCNTESPTESPSKTPTETPTKNPSESPSEYYYYYYYEEDDEETDYWPGDRQDGEQCLWSSQCSSRRCIDRVCQGNRNLIVINDDD